MLCCQRQPLVLSPMSRLMWLHLQDTTLELNYGRRYGLIGRNGSGKSTFLEALAFNDLELPPHIDKYLLSTEADPTDNTAMEEVQFGALFHSSCTEGLQCPVCNPLSASGDCVCQSRGRSTSRS